MGSLPLAVFGKAITDCLDEQVPVHKPYTERGDDIVQTESYPKIRSSYNNGYYAIKTQSDAAVGWCSSSQSLCVSSINDSKIANLDEMLEGVNTLFREFKDISQNS